MVAFHSQAQSQESQAQSCSAQQARASADPQGNKLSKSAAEIRTLCCEDKKGDHNATTMHNAVSIRVFGPVV